MGAVVTRDSAGLFGIGLGLAAGQVPLGLNKMYIVGKLALITEKIIQIG